MSITIQPRPMSDREVRAGEIYRYFRDTNMTLMNRDGKIGKNKLRRLAEDKAFKDIECILKQNGL